MTRLKIALLTSIVSIIPVAHAEVTIKPLTRIVLENAYQTPSDASLQQLAQVKQFDKVLDKMNQKTQVAMAEMFEINLATITHDKQLTPQQNEQAKQLMQKFILDVAKDYNTPQNRQQFIKAFIEANKAVYTQQEIEAMIAFYSSPIGQQIVEKQDQFAIENMKRLNLFNAQLQQQLMQDKVPKFIADMEKITHQPKPKAHKK